MVYVGKALSQTFGGGRGFGDPMLSIGMNKKIKTVGRNKETISHFFSVFDGY
jgi:hypothetical protein